MRKKLLFLCLALWAAVGVRAAQVDTVLVHSSSMNKDIKVIAVCPDRMKTGERCPVVYLLHGCGDDEAKWLQVKPNLPEIADKEGIIFVCPSANRDSWYWDSPRNPEIRYETFVSKELVAFVDEYYLTLADKGHRAITGLSMGGHGAMWLAIRHKDVFGAVGTTSGGLDIRPFPNHWNMKNQLGERDENLDVWNNHTVVNQLERLKQGDLDIIIDCGIDDFFLAVNKMVHDRLSQLKIPHDFILRPGGHNNEYWNNAIDYQILFFRKFFDRQNK